MGHDLTLPEFPFSDNSWAAGNVDAALQLSVVWPPDMIARAEETSVPARIEWPLQNLLGDLRVQYGTKLGLAGILALFCASVLRLEHSTWSILTVVVMMSSQYVGSITVKVILRISGTISGALLGIWLVGSYASSPVVLLIALFFVMAFATYKFGQYPASQTPYFHFLVGLTLLTVTTYGVDAPNGNRQIGCWKHWLGWELNLNASLSPGFFLFRQSLFCT